VNAGVPMSWRDLWSEAASRLPNWATILVGALLVAGLSVIDYLTGYEVSFSIFYLVPVLYVTWYAGRGWGVFFALLSAATWGVADVASGARYASIWIPLWNSSVRLGFFFLAAHLLDSLHRAHERMTGLAHTDSLTGLVNARSFSWELEREIDRQRRYGSPFTMAYLDVDRFKEVNDTCGHAAGDRVLRTLAAEMADALRVSDTVGRLGGDEFGVLMPDTGEDAARATLSRMQTALSRSVRPLECDVPGVGVTIGAVVFESPPESAEVATRMADEAMYGGKRLGRGRLYLEVWAACDAPVYADA
jgi:diguanylate cyclase (GGDEF)-like protein